MTKIELLKALEQAIKDGNKARQYEIEQILDARDYLANDSNESLVE